MVTSSRQLLQLLHATSNRLPDQFTLGDFWRLVSLQSGVPEFCNVDHPRRDRDGFLEVVWNNECERHCKMGYMIRWPGDRSEHKKGTSTDRVACLNAVEIEVSLVCGSG